MTKFQKENILINVAGKELKFIMENNWYIYMEDINGVNALLVHSSKKLLADCISDEEFLEMSMPEGVSKSDSKKITELSKQFVSDIITPRQYATKLFKIIENNEGDTTTLYIEDFEGLCEGKTDFGKMAVLYFYEISKLKPMPNVATESKEAFKKFLDNADGVWVG